MGFEIKRRTASGCQVFCIVKKAKLRTRGEAELSEAKSAGVSMVNILELNPRASLELTGGEL
ncbi:hypothetical protein EQG63_01115 [Flavobacterium amnicola]|uniref:Uncharacterized protein n=1 Tax=Flavobacterium amnicola TaxID=2506422 RepID=A0A4Q1K414_9FLAO|nr:hypothetical protein [Flavobacterium amnicola]RXR20563.1 hypothetical protein EQG63_01115 [Flavobacterium amnicola]